MGRRIKYLGASHYRVLEKGEDFGGRLADPLSKRVVWGPENNHLVDAEDAGLSDTALDLLLEHEATVYGEAGLVEEDQNTGKTIHEFADVSDKDRIPTSLWEQSWRPHLGKSVAVKADEDQATTTASTTSGQASGPTSAGTRAAGGGTRTGGSTGGGTGAAGGTTVGGSGTD